MIMMVRNNHDMVDLLKWLVVSDNNCEYRYVVVVEPVNVDRSNTVHVDHSSD